MRYSQFDINFIKEAKKEELLRRYNGLFVKLILERLSVDEETGTLLLGGKHAADVLESFLDAFTGKQAPPFKDKIVVPVNTEMDTIKYLLSEGYIVEVKG